MTAADGSKPPPPPVPCPVCGRPRDARLHPFCSQRCADVDLGRWLTGSYAIPVADDEEPDDEPDHGRRTPPGQDFED